MQKLIIPPVFAISERNAWFDDQTKYCIWIGPSLEDIRILYHKWTPIQLKIKEPELLRGAPEEILSKIAASHNEYELNEGITDYNEQHGESAVLLCILREQLFHI